MSRPPNIRRREPARGNGCTNRFLSLLLGVAVAGLAGCGGDSALPGDGEAERGVDDASRTAVTPAVYTTTLAFLGSDSPSPRLFLRFENRTSPKALDVEYGGWLWDGEIWRKVLEVRESAGVPRAAWRVLPVRPLRIAVSEGEQLAALSFSGPVGQLQLRLGELLAEWASATGQREFLARAVVELAGDEQTGIVLGSQTARVAEAAFRGGERALLLADTLGHALVILLSGTAADAPVVVHTLLGEQSRRWDGAALAEAVVDSTSDREAAASPVVEAADRAIDSIVGNRPAGTRFERYALRVPGAEIEGVVALAVPDTAAPAESAVGLPEVVASITLAGEELTMSGFEVTLSRDRGEGVEP